jgi:hypothetical protein
MIIKNSKYPVYKDLDQLKIYDFDTVNDIHQDIIRLIEYITKIIHQNEEEIKAHQLKVSNGLNIDNYIFNLEYRNNLIVNNISLYKKFLSAYHKYHASFLCNLNNKLSLILEQLKNDVNFTEPIKEPQQILIKMCVQCSMKEADYCKTCMNEERDEYERFAILRDSINSEMNNELDNSKPKNKKTIESVNPEPVNEAPVNEIIPEPVNEAPVIDSPIVDEIIPEPIVDVPVIDEIIPELIVNVPVVEAPVIIDEPLIDVVLVDSPIIDEIIPEPVVESQVIIDVPVVVIPEPIVDVPLVESEVVDEIIPEPIVDEPVIVDEPLIDEIIPESIVDVPVVVIPEPVVEAPVIIDEPVVDLPVVDEIIPEPVLDVALVDVLINDEPIVPVIPDIVNTISDEPLSPPPYFNDEIDEPININLQEYVSPIQLSTIIEQNDHDESVDIGIDNTTNTEQIEQKLYRTSPFFIDLELVPENELSHPHQNRKKHNKKGHKK